MSEIVSIIITISTDRCCLCRGLTYLALVHEAENRIDEAKEATRASLEICRTITPSEFKTGFGLHKMAGFLHREGKLEDALYVLFLADLQRF